MSNFGGFDVKVDNGTGMPILIPGATVMVRDITDVVDETTGAGGTALSDLTADSNGHVVGGTLPIAVGRKVRFGWVRSVDLRMGSAVTTTT
ncbi:MAG: hypothetical protein QOH63_1994 [Acidobacteriota bacterium]|jgi:hypothetical protein|nr:hypothetical protein [Acidobacteriota bacterium]